MGLEIEIESALESTFQPEVLQVINESHLHAGHAGDDGSGESHWKVVITSRQFKEMSRLERHRAIHAALGPEILGRLHALSLEIT